MLKPIPPDVAKIIEEYNTGVDKLLTAFLQLSAPNKKVQVVHFPEVVHRQPTLAAQPQSL